MSVHAEGSVVDIYLRRGTPIFAECDTLASSLGRSLLREGVLTAEHYEQVVDEMTKNVFDSEAMCLAEVVVQLGYLDHQSMNSRLEKYVRETITGCMRWTEPEVQFLANAEAASLVASYPCKVAPLVLSGVKAYYDVARSTEVWQPNEESYAELTRPAGETATLYAMKPDELRHLSLVDGTRSVRDLVQGGDLDTLHAGQIVAALLLTDGVRLFASPQDTTVESLRPTSSLPVVSEAARRRMSSPLLQAVREPAPTVVANPAEQVVVSHPRVPVPVPSPIDRNRAEKLFLHGKRLFTSAALGKAQRAFERATELDPQSPEYALYLAWCRFIKNPPADSAAALDQLQRLAQKALAEDDRSAFAHYVIGRVALSQGDFQQAKRALRMAARLDPKNTDAKRFLRSVSKK